MKKIVFISGATASGKSSFAHKLIDKYFNNNLQLSIGISQANGVNTIIIPKGTPLPAKYTTMATTSADGQTNVAFDVVQGERKMAKDCIKLGHLTVNGIQVAKRCEPKIEIVMEIDESGFLHVSASDLTTGVTISANLSSNSNLSEEDIVNILNEAEKHKEKMRENSSLVSPSP